MPPSVCGLGGLDVQMFAPVGRGFRDGDVWWTCGDGLLMRDSARAWIAYHWWMEWHAWFWKEEEVCIHDFGFGAGGGACCACGASGLQHSRLPSSFREGERGDDHRG